MTALIGPRAGATAPAAAGQEDVSERQWRYQEPRRC